MSIVGKNIDEALKALDQQLAIHREKRELIVCGGGALSVMGIISRETRDLDVIVPSIDSLLLKCSEQVAIKLGLDKEWLNNGPSGFVRDLEAGFELRTGIIFEGTFLTVRALGRRDFIATKLQGMCDRDEFDLEDILRLKPAISEIESLRSWLINRDTSKYWPARVESQLEKLFKRIKDGK